MASNRLGFNLFVRRAEELSHIDIILDSNILIAYFDESHRQYGLVNEFVSDLDKATEVDFFSTVTVKSEFLDYRRRFHLTDSLLPLVDAHGMGLGLTIAAKTAITSQKALLNKRREPDDELSVEDEFDIELNPERRLFFDIEIKRIKKAFRARTVQDERGWVEICKTYLAEKLVEDEKLIDEFTNYLTTRNDQHKAHFFGGKDIEWVEATNICSTIGMGYSDAMILNIFQSTSIPYLATLDYDMVYGTSVSLPGKTVLTPDERIKDYKRPLKGAAEILDFPQQLPNPNRRN